MKNEKMSTKKREIKKNMYEKKQGKSGTNKDQPLKV
jgi:hypothetical protein